MADRLCPLCQSSNTGGYPRTRLSTERGRVDIDDWVCLDCRCSWQYWDYVREDTHEDHEIRRGNGHRLAWEAWGEPPPPQCRSCKSLDVKYVQCDGRWHRPGTEILRYECKACAAVWLEYVRIDDGKRLFWRLWSGRK